MYDIPSDVVEEIRITEHHMHHRCRTFGKSVDQSGNNWATENSLTPFRCISGNADFGSDLNDEAKIFGSSDTPFISGHNFFDPGEILVDGVSVSTKFILRLVWGDSDIATALAAGQYSCKPIKFDSTNPTVSAGFPVNFGSERIPVGYKVWMQCMNATDNAYVDFLIDSHGYI